MAVRVSQAVAIGYFWLAKRRRLIQQECRSPGSVWCSRFCFVTETFHIWLPVTNTHAVAVTRITKGAENNRREHGQRVRFLRHRCETNDHITPWILDDILHYPYCRICVSFFCLFLKWVAFPLVESRSQTAYLTLLRPYFNCSGLHCIFSVQILLWINIILTLTLFHWILNYRKNLKHSLLVLLQSPSSWSRLALCSTLTEPMCFLHIAPFETVAWFGDWEVIVRAWFFLSAGTVHFPPLKRKIDNFLSLCCKLEPRMTFTEPSSHILTLACRSVTQETIF